MSRWPFVLAVLFAASPPPVWAAGGEKPPRRAIDEDAMVKSGFAGFVDSHPDLYFHKLGARAYGQGDYARAMRLFRRAARYADKPSQAMVAQMLWSGLGVQADRAAAYAWMDLAAERGYPELLELREGLWAEMDEAERERALVVGRDVYDEFGDDVAQPRILAKLRRAERSVAGSRTGSTGNARIMALPPDAGARDREGENYVEIDAREYYAAAYWQPEHYFKWRELRWREDRAAQARMGTVTASGLQTAAPESPEAGP